MKKGLKRGIVFGVVFGVVAFLLFDTMSHSERFGLGLLAVGICSLIGAWCDWIGATDVFE